MKFQKIFNFSAVLCLLGIVACTAKENAEQKIPVVTAFAHLAESAVVDSSSGQTVYIPVYSHIPTSEKEVLSLRALLSVRNTSDKESLIITQINYYDTNGKLLKKFLENPISLNNMATFEVEISTHDLSGGAGANFIVKWDSANKISAPIIETLMYGASGPQSYSFISRGQVVERH